MTEPVPPGLPPAANHLADALAERLGESAAPPPALGLGVSGPLLLPADPRLDSELQAHLAEPWPADPRAAWQQRVASALRRWLGASGRVVLAADPQELLAAMLGACCVRTGRTVSLALEPLAERPAGASPVARAEARQRLARGDVAAILFEPRIEAPAEVETLRAIVAQARAHGTVVIADESRTAGRWHAGSAAHALDLDVDAVVVGPSVACGRPFAASVDRSGEPSVAFGERPPGTLALVLAGATAEVLARTPVHAALAARGEAMRARFASACARERIAGEMVGPAALGRFRFPPQEGVAGPLLQWHFAVELERAGARGGDWCVPHAGWAAIERQLGAALEAAIGRLRTLLIENNSYISGGLPYVFHTDVAPLRERGLGVYRYPKKGPTSVTAQGGGVRIAFAAGDLGEIVSSGFFVPTHVTGDFEVQAEYELAEWSAGPDAACLGLFFQNDLSTGRYYAQRSLSPAGDDAVHGSFDGVLTPAVPVRERRGAMRLARTDSCIRAWHRSGAGDEWVDLGGTSTATTDDGIVGMKIWAKVACAGLVAEVSSLTLRATIAPDQKPPPPVRADPRPR